ncbi:MAG: hypothetical protein COB04_15000 [Gammaproteobacteria bacterium]|nr:MAG: hypothetical protein COB04_15000 [Gammaproteobacteria bacterium]
MSAIKELRRNPHARSALLAPVRQIGLKNLARTLSKTLLRSRLKRPELGRQFLLSYWETLGDQEAIIVDNETLSFAEYRDRVLRLADSLHTLGLKPGDGFAELLNNGTTWFEAMGAGTLTGIHMPMLNWHLKPDELVHCINISKARVLLFDLDYLQAIQQIKDQLPGVEHFIIVGAEQTPEGMLDYEELLQQASPTLPAGKLDMAPKPFSGGTTGTPKFMNIDRDKLGSEDSEDRRGASKEDIARLSIMQLTMLHWYRLGDVKDPISKNLRSLIPGPLYHAGVQLAVLPFFVGGTVVPMRKFSAESFLKHIQDHRINWTFVAPTMLERVLALPEEIQSKYDLSTMRSMICAAAPCPPKVKKDINALFRQQGNPGDVFYEYYAASETGFITLLVPEDYQEDPKRYQSVGKIRGCDCQIYDEEKKQWVKQGGEGKILVRTPMVYGLQYAGVSEQDMRKCFIEIEGQLWYDDGLIGYVDENQYLYLTSRVKEMIISGGVNLFPNEIENTIKTHSAVLDVAVVRAPHKDLGEIPAAVIQLKPGESLLPEDIIKHCKDEGLYGFKIPKIVEFVEQLPRNLAGKLPKKELEAKYWQGVESHG